MEEDLLEGMRHVARHPKKLDETLLHKQLRAWFEEDRRGFLEKLGELELENWRAGRRVGAEASGEGVSEEAEWGDVELVEWVSNWLRERGCEVREAGSGEAEGV